MGYRVTSDIGGTFTDVVVADEAGNLVIGKALTTTTRLFEGLQNALASAAKQIGLGGSSLLHQTDLFVYSTTQATNAILEGKTGKTALLVTEGFPDILVRREGGRLNPYDFTKPFPEPYVPRRLTFEIRERIDSEGDVVIPLDEEQAREVVGVLGERGVEAVAVCFLWSIVNSKHELAMGRLLEEGLLGVPYTLSYQLNPIIREYRRASCAAIDASLKPLMQEHLREMERGLRETGFIGELVAATSFGGIMHMDDLIERPIYAVKSGPSLAPVAGRMYAETEFEAREVIVCDTGGTSFDVSLIRDGEIVFTRETWLGEQFSGHLTGLSSVDVRSIGAGGGSIAWLDPGGLLQVGPESAGADPGPACYGRGGRRPTVTDAAVVLGYIDPEYFLGGQMVLDPKAARRTVRELADRLDFSLEHAAHAILTVANEHMVEAIKMITINEGVDPRESLIVAGGGAAGMTIVPIASELGCRRVVVPRTAGALSAFGAQYSDIVAEFSVSEYTNTSDFAYEDVSAALKSIDASIDEFSERLRHRGFKEFRTDYFVEARYTHQVWEIEIPLAKGRIDGPAGVELIAEDFHEAHERIFAVKEPGQAVECVHWKGRLVASIDKPPLQNLASSSEPTAHPEKERPAYFAATGQVMVPLYDGVSVPAGARIEGPAIIEEPTTTVVVYPDSSVAVTSLGNYLLEMR